jgi:hypothetical protein
MAGFPNTPSIGDTYTVGTITWEWNGTAWTVKSAGTIDISLSDLSDVTITTPTSNEVLKYDGSEWKNSNSLDGGGF